MEKLPIQFIGRTFRALLFIIVVILLCTAISGAGVYLASKYGLTTSVEQAPLTFLSIGAEGEVELPIRGRMTEGEGWKLRNSRDVYTLTLDNAVIEGPVTEDGPQPAMVVNGDLIIELKKDSGSWIRSEGVGIYNEAGVLVMKGEGSLTIESKGQALYAVEQGDKPCAFELEAEHLQINGSQVPEADS